MTVERCPLWGAMDKAFYTRYLHSNSGEVEAGRTYGAVVVCGSGGYLRLSEREGEPVALWLLSRGYQVFVLEYATKSAGSANYPLPVYDLAKMVMTIRENAEEWHVDPAQVAVMGFSVGGHLCACLATEWNEAYLKGRFGGDAARWRPDAVVLCYPLLDFLYQQKQFALDPNPNAVSPSKGLKKGDYLQVVYEAGVGVGATEEQFRAASPINHVSAGTPPTFLWHTVEDELVYVGQSLQFAQRLGEVGVPYELHVFESGPHGMALADRSTSGNPRLIDPDIHRWTELCLAFLTRHFR